MCICVRVCVCVCDQCTHCSKAFINASFLHAHVARRHPESVNITPPTGRGAAAVVRHLNVEAAPITEATPPSAAKDPEFARELEEIRERLRNTESQLVEERNSRLELLKKVRLSCFKATD